MSRQLLPCCHAPAGLEFEGFDGLVMEGIVVAKPRGESWFCLEMATTGVVTKAFFHGCPIMFVTAFFLGIPILFVTCCF